MNCKKLKMTTEKFNSIKKIQLNELKIKKKN